MITEKMQRFEEKAIDARNRVLFSISEMDSSQAFEFQGLYVRFTRLNAQIGT
jgi:hypothetical protein